MKLSNDTVGILKNFASINQNLIIKEGSELTTMSAMKNIVARAKVMETFPKEEGGLRTMPSHETEHRRLDARFSIPVLPQLGSLGAVQEYL